MQDERLFTLKDMEKIFEEKNSTLNTARLDLGEEEVRLEDDGPAKLFGEKTILQMGKYRYWLANGHSRKMSKALTLYLPCPPTIKEAERFTVGIVWRRGNSGKGVLLNGSESALRLYETASDLHSPRVYNLMYIMNWRFFMDVMKEKLEAAGL